MREDKKFNYIFLFYDVGEKRVGKIFKICKKYLSPYQKSVFRGIISPSSIIDLKNELNNILDPTVDKLTIIKLINNDSFREENLGTNTYNTENIFI